LVKDVEYPTFDQFNQKAGKAMIQNINDNGRTNKSSGKIMVVDDDSEFLWILTTLFKLHGYQVNSASSGLEALDLIENNNPDVIILDINMPGMDGWETYQHLRNQTDAPVLILTGSEPLSGTISTLQAGTNNLMQKPFHSNDLLERVETLVNHSRKQAHGEGQRSSNHTTRVRPTVSLIIPTLNEAKNLPLILPYLPMELISEVLLVDGRSTDGTVETARKIMPSIKVVLEKTPGKGAAMLAGYRASKSEIIMVMDADGSNDPREIPRYLNALMLGADFVKGSRFAPGGGTTDMPRIRRLGNAAFVHIVNLLFNSTFTDLCYGFHAFWAYSLCTLDLTDVNGFEIDTALYLRALNDKLKLTEVPSFEGYRFYGQGKLRTIPDGFRVLTTIIKEFLRSILHPNRDLQMGFKGEAIQHKDLFTIVNVKESSFNR
jgi:CheY-like chemotaxis protein